MSSKDSNASSLIGFHYCLHSWVNNKQGTPYKLWRLIVFIFIDVYVHIDLKSKYFVRENLIKNQKSRCGNWLQVCNLLLEIGFVARCNGGDEVCNEITYCNNDCSIWNLVGTQDLRDDKMAFGNLEDGIKAFCNVVVLVCIET